MTGRRGYGSFLPGPTERQQTERQTDRQAVDPLAHEVLQHRALPSALAANHSDLRKIEVADHADGGEGILEPVHQRDQLLHTSVPHDGEMSLKEKEERGPETDR